MSTTVNGTADDDFDGLDGTILPHINNANQLSQEIRELSEELIGHPKAPMGQQGLYQRKYDLLQILLDTRDYIQALEDPEAYSSGHTSPSAASTANKSSNNPLAQNEAPTAAHTSDLTETLEDAVTHLHLYKYSLSLSLHNLQEPADEEDSEKVLKQLHKFEDRANKMLDTLNKEIHSTEFHRSRAQASIQRLYRFPTARVPDAAEEPHMSDEDKEFSRTDFRYHAGKYYSELTPTTGDLRSSIRKQFFVDFERAYGVLMEHSGFIGHPLDLPTLALRGLDSLPEPQYKPTRAAYDRIKEYCEAKANTLAELLPRSAAQVQGEYNPETHQGTYIADDADVAALRLLIPLHEVMERTFAAAELANYDSWVFEERGKPVVSHPSGYPTVSIDGLHALTGDKQADDEARKHMFPLESVLGGLLLFWQRHFDPALKRTSIIREYKLLDSEAELARWKDRLLQCFLIAGADIEVMEMVHDEWGGAWGDALRLSREYRELVDSGMPADWAWTMCARYYPPFRASDEEIEQWIREQDAEADADSGEEESTYVDTDGDR